MSDEMFEEMTSMPGFRPAPAPVQPNASKVRGRLVQITPRPEGLGEVWAIAVDDVASVDGLLNFAEAHVGDVIAVYVNERLRHRFTEQDRLEARIAFRGDQRGGRFVLIKDNVRRVSPEQRVGAMSDQV
jgi:hypothetical protein